MRALPAVLAVVGGAAVGLLFVFASSGMAAKDVRCPGGRFLIDAEPLMAGGVAQDAVIVTGRRIEIASGCRNVRGTIVVDDEGTRIDVRWPRGACGAGTPRTRMRARYDRSCGRVAGTLRAHRGVERAFVARRSWCGDGLVDPGAGEQCDGADFGGRGCPLGVAGTACMRCTSDCRIDIVPMAVGGGGDFALKVHGSGRFAIMELQPALYARWRDGRQTVQEVRALVRTTSQFFADVFDFVILVADEATPASDAYQGLHYQVQNDVAGIGPLVDSSARYGTWARLQGVIHLTHQGALRAGAGLHELAHRWGNYVLPTSSRASDAHWNFSSAGGQLGGWQDGTLVELGDGLYQAGGPGGHVSFQPHANGGATVPYSSLELYLMGLIAPDEVVQPIEVADGAEWVDATRGIFRADRIRSVSMPELLAQHGPRIPDVSTAQKAFRALVVVLAPAPLTPDRLALHDTDVAAFSAAADDGSYLLNFWEATGGRATIQMDDLFAVTRSARVSPATD